MATPTQIEANRQNATRSTGPTSAHGKTISRANSLKHGLAGEGVVVRPDEVAEVEARANAYARQLRPGNEMSRGLVRRAAVLAVRVDRCAELEIAAIAALGRQAEREYAEHFVREVEATFDDLADAPPGTLRNLMRTEGGLARLADAWSDLKADLDNGLWSLDHAGRLANLKGYKADSCHASAYFDLSEALMGIDNPGRNGRSRHIRPESRCGWARAELTELIGDELMIHEDLLASVDPARSAQERADHITLAKLSPTPEMLRLRRYEAAAERAMYRNLKEARLVDSDPSPAERVIEPPAPTPIPPTPPEKLASFPPEPSYPPAPFEIDPKADTTPLNDVERGEINDFLGQFGDDYARLIREVGEPREDFALRRAFG